MDEVVQTRINGRAWEEEEMTKWQRLYEYDIENDIPVRKLEASRGLNFIATIRERDNKIAKLRSDFEIVDEECTRLEQVDLQNTVLREELERLRVHIGEMKIQYGEQIDALHTSVRAFEETISRLDHENYVMGEALNVIARGTAELNGHKHPLAVIAQEALDSISDKGDE